MNFEKENCCHPINYRPDENYKMKKIKRFPIKLGNIIINNNYIS